MTVFKPKIHRKGKAMQRFFVKQGISAAICITMALSVCAFSLSGTISEASINIVSEISSQAADSIEIKADEKLNTAKAVRLGFVETAVYEIGALKAEVSRAIVPEP